MVSSKTGAARKSAPPRQPDDADAIPKAGLRERKAAATRVALTRALWTRLTTHDLVDITADDLAADASVSRVTFFNYFPTKEHALDALLGVWLYEAQASGTSRGLRGRGLIEHLFATMGERVQESPARARRLLAYFAGRPLNRPFVTFGRLERELLAPGLDPAHEPQTLGDLLAEHVGIARRAGEIDGSSSDYEMAHMLGCLLLGAATVGHSKPNQDWRRIYMHHVRRALGSAGGDVSTAARRRSTETTRKRR